MSNSVRILKLDTGDDVIGVINELELAEGKGNKVIELKAPHYIMMKPKKDTANEFVLGLTPYAPYAKNASIAFIPAHIVSICDPNDDLLKEFIRRFDEGVVRTDDPTVKQVLKEETH